MTDTQLIVACVALYILAMVGFARLVNGPFRPARRAPRKPSTQPVNR